MRRLPKKKQPSGKITNIHVNMIEREEKEKEEVTMGIFRREKHSNVNTNQATFIRSMLFLLLR